MFLCHSVLDTESSILITGSRLPPGRRLDSRLRTLKGIHDGNDTMYIFAGIVILLLESFRKHIMDIPYTLKKSRKRRKTISLQIGDKSELVIAAPHFTPVSEINRFVQEKQDWISKAIQKHKEALVKNRAKEYTAGEHFYYLGKSYPLEVFFEPLENAGVVFWGNRFFLNAQENKDLRKHYFILWYKKKAHKYISERVDFFSRMLKLQAGNIRITSAESRWGSCSEDNNLAFSFRLIMAKPEVIDYVVVHELMHIKEKNHSAGFWRLVESVMPQYKLLRRWLKDNNSKFVL